MNNNSTFLKANLIHEDFHHVDSTAVN